MTAAHLRAMGQRLADGPDYPPWDGKRLARGNALVDAMPAELRACVHEFGLPIVQTCLEQGVTQPNRIRHLVTVIWGGPRNAANNPAHGAARGNSGLAQLDWLLIQSGAHVTAATLLRSLAANGLVVVPRDPAPAAVEASMAALDGYRLLPKREKHLIRLRAALKAAVAHAWPHLGEGV